MRERLARLPRPTEQLDELVRVKSSHLRRAILPAVGDIVGVVSKVTQVQGKGTVGLDAHHLAHFIEVFRLAIGRQTHHFVLIAVMGKPDKLGDRRVKNA